MEIENEYFKARKFICKDSSLVYDIHGKWEPGPRSTMYLYIDDGKVESTTTEIFFYPTEKAFHQAVEWDAWIHCKWKTYDTWRASIKGKITKNEPSLNLRYTDFEPKDHEKFYTDMASLDETELKYLDIWYADKLSVKIGAQRCDETTNDTEMIRINLRVAIYSNSGF